MRLRPQLLPPKLDEQLVQNLSRLASELDGARPGEWEALLLEFNDLAKTTLQYEHFQGIYGAEEHIDWVRRLLVAQCLQTVQDASREELVEVARRAMDPRDSQAEAYRAILDKNFPGLSPSQWIFYPPDQGFDTKSESSNINIADYDPSPEEIVDWALQACKKRL